jgi:uncharacterized protein YukE
MSDILVKPEQLNRVASKLQDRAKNIETACQQVDKSLSSLKGNRFLGQRAEALMARYQLQRASMTNYHQLIVGFATQLLEAATIFRKADNIDTAEKGTSKIIGDSVDLSKFVEQQQGNTCALYAQGTAMEALTGQKFDIEEAKKLGIKVGYIDILGVEGILGLGDYWKYYGIPYTSFKSTSILSSLFNPEKDFKDASTFLIDNIKANHAVVVGVDPRELYKGILDVSVSPLNPEGHAVWVTGLRVDNSGEVTHVVINDSALDSTEEIPIAQFMEGWSQKSYQAVASTNEMKNI